MESKKDMTSQEILDQNLIEDISLVGETYSVPFTYTAKYLTKEDALKLLKRNKRNRKISSSKLREYRGAMENGSWQLNGEPILFSEDGTLLNGQHRLLSIASLEKGEKIPVVIGVGMNNNAFDTIDIGKKRSPGDLLSLYGVDSREAGTLAAACKLMYRYLVIHEIIKDSNTNLQSKDIYNFIQKEEYRNLFIEGIKEVLANTSTLLLARSESLFMFVLLVGIDEEKGKKFCNHIFTQTGIEANTPLHVLVGRLNRSANKGTNINRSTRIACTIKTWNYFINNLSMSPALISRSGIKEPDKIKALPNIKEVTHGK